MQVIGRTCRLTPSLEMNTIKFGKNLVVLPLKVERVGEHLPALDLAARRKAVTAPRVVFSSACATTLLRPQCTRTTPRTMSQPAKRSRGLCIGSLGLLQNLMCEGCAMQTKTLRGRHPTSGQRNAFCRSFVALACAGESAVMRLAPAR